MSVSYTFNQCARHCRRRYGGLATIHSEKDEKQVMKACREVLVNPKSRDTKWSPGNYRGKSCWIGLRERKTHGVSKWMDNTAVKYKKWARGQSRYWKRGQSEQNQKHRHLLESDEAGWKQERYSDYNRKYHCVELMDDGRDGQWRERKCFERKSCVCEEPRGQVHGRYIGVSAVRNYHQAQKHCYFWYGAELATISSDEDNRQVMEACRAIVQPNSQARCWIGLKRPFNDWVDGTEAKFFNWAKGQPDNSGRSENCVEMWVSNHKEMGRGKWNDVHCARRRNYFVCNLQSKVQRMDYEDREKMIKKRMHHHERRWREYRKHEYREKMRKKYRQMLGEQQMKKRKEAKEQLSRQKEYVRDMLYQRMLAKNGLNAPYKRYATGMMRANKLMGKGFGGHFQQLAQKANSLVHQLGRGSTLQHRRRRMLMDRTLRGIASTHREGEDVRLEDAIYSKMENNVSLESVAFDAFNAFDAFDDAEYRVLEGGSNGHGYAEMTDEDWDILTMDPLRCVRAKGLNGIYQICLNLQLLSVQKQINTAEGMERGFEGVFRSNDHGQRQRHRDGDGDGVLVNVSGGARWVEQDVYDFGHDLNETRQCFDFDHQRWTLCLEYDIGRRAMALDLVSPSKEHRFEFENDGDWMEVNHIETRYDEGPYGDQLSKCTVSFHRKICVVQQCQVHDGDEEKSACDYTLILSRRAR